MSIKLAFGLTILALIAVMVVRDLRRRGKQTADERSDEDAANHDDPAW